MYFHTEIKIKTYVCHNSPHLVLLYNLVYIHRWQYHMYHLDSCLDYSPAHSYHYQDNNVYQRTFTLWSNEIPEYKPVQPVMCEGWNFTRT
jgi:hypothetical protein